MIGRRRQPRYVVICKIAGLTPPSNRGIPVLETTQYNVYATTPVKQIEGNILNETKLQQRLLALEQTYDGAFAVTLVDRNVNDTPDSKE